MSLRLLLYTLQRYVLPTGTQVGVEVEDLLAHLRTLMCDSSATSAFGMGFRAARCVLRPSTPAAGSENIV